MTAGHSANSAIVPASSRGLGVRAAVMWMYKFVRFPALGFTAMLPLLGAATVTLEVDRWLWVGLLGVAVLFHAFAYVHNDVVDLRIDRTEPQRADSPLVQDSIRPRHALAFALAQVPLAFLVSRWMGASAAADAALAAAFALMAIYNLCGKRCPWPPITDALQSLGWCSLAAYGGLIAGGPLGGATALLAAHVFVYVMMINGVHGGLRDLDNDRRHGVRTTAIFFGAERRGNRLVLPNGFAAYTLTLQGALVALTLGRLTRGWPAGSDGSWPIAAGLSASLTLVSIGLLVLVGRALHHRSGLGLIGALHLVASLGLLPSLYAVPLGSRGAAVVFGVYAVPVLAMWVHNGSRWE